MAMLLKVNPFDILPWRACDCYTCPSPQDVVKYSHLYTIHCTCISIGIINYGSLSARGYRISIVISFNNEVDLAWNVWKQVIFVVFTILPGFSMFLHYVL